MVAPVGWPDEDAEQVSRHRFARRAVCAYSPCVNCPSCRFAAADVFRFSENVLTQTPNQKHHPRRPASMRGALWPIVTEREAGCDGRDGVSAQSSRGRMMSTRTKKSCGPDT